MSKVLFRSYGRSIFPERGTGGGVIGVTLHSTVSFLACVPAVRKDIRAVFFILRLRSISITDKVGRGERDAGGSLTSAAALFVCMPLGREDECA